MKLKFAFALLAFGLLTSGCAGIMEFRLPPEFKGKKQVEDPPLSYHPNECGEACPA